ncbi:MAG: DUF4143 domain-containing protein, partial [Propionibacteriaceae bacterium]|nr:DUF4143 domain-containing protein [Propionibacteriaceae bacterium]
DPIKVSALIAALARNTATTVTNATLIRDMSDVDSIRIDPRTVADYLDTLRRLFVLNEIPPWAPALRSPVRFRQAPKRMLTDPSLATAALGATAATLAADRKTLGLFVESLVLRDLRIFADANQARLFHYRDNAGLEADAIITWPDGRWGAFEIKLGEGQIDTAASNLIRLRDKIVAGGDRPPTVLATIIATGGFSHQRPDGTLVLPFDRLAP